MLESLDTNDDGCFIARSDVPAHSGLTKLFASHDNDPDNRLRR